VPTLDYVYCVVPATFPLANAPVGIDDTQLRLVPYDDVAALVSTLDGDTYAPPQIEHNVTSVDWLKPRAIAHDRIVTWASDHDATVPLPMWTIFSDHGAIAQALGTLTPKLRESLDTVRGAREYTVRLFADLTKLLHHASTLSPRLAELEQSIATASPGQAYLLRKKLDAERKTEVRAIARHIADETFTTLAAHAKDATRDPLPQSDEATAILNASFLVETATYDPFRQSLTDLVTRYTSNGFHFDFTGPWPAYHFVRVA
jgi:hypothetical protein